MDTLFWRLTRVCSSLVFALLLLICTSDSVIAATPLPEMDPKGYPAPNTGCLAPGKCHAEMEPIRAHNSDMAKQIYEKGKALGDPNGCVICHGGDPSEEKDAKKAHTGAPEGGSLDSFVLHSASVWVNKKIVGILFVSECIQTDAYPVVRENAVPFRDRCFYLFRFGVETFKGEIQIFAIIDHPHQSFLR